MQNTLGNNRWKDEDWKDILLPVKHKKNSGDRQEVIVLPYKQFYLGVHYGFCPSI